MVMMGACTSIAEVGVVGGGQGPTRNRADKEVYGRLMRGGGEGWEGKGTCFAME